MKILSYAVKIGIFILPACFLIASSLFFFPFITGKNFFFRIVVEILFLLWVVLAVFDADYRPKKSPVIFALTATLFILSLATIFGENPYRSFWSNFERMEGLIGHIHLFLYFLIIFLRAVNGLHFFAFKKVRPISAQKNYQHLIYTLYTPSEGVSIKVIHR